MTRIKPDGNREDIFEAVLRKQGFTDPYDYNLEIEVVGYFLKDPSKLNQFQEMLAPDMFYDKWTRRLYENIYKLYLKGEIDRINAESLVLRTNDEHRDRVIRDILNQYQFMKIGTEEMARMVVRLNELAFRRRMLNIAFCILEDSYGESSAISRNIAFAEELSKRIMQYVTDIEKLV